MFFQGFPKVSTCLPAPPSPGPFPLRVKGKITEKRCCCTALLCNNTVPVLLPAEEMKGAESGDFRKALDVYCLAVFML
jgi:hypothetical protein